MADAPVTEWLARWRAGDTDAIERIVPLVYNELRQVARRQLLRESPGHTLSATALVHEVYLRLLQQRQLAAWRCSISAPTVSSNAAFSPGSRSKRPRKS